jgi:hypothetical protein
MAQDHSRNESHRAASSRKESARPERLRGERTPRIDAMDVPAEIGPRTVNAGLRMQQQMLDVFEDIGREWFTRATSKAELALKLPSKLTTAGTLPEAVFAYQEWLGEWMNVFNDDSRRIISDGQKIIDAGVRCFAETSPLGSS